MGNALPLPIVAIGLPHSSAPSSAQPRARTAFRSKVASRLRTSLEAFPTVEWTVGEERALAEGRGG
jgi:hypothetical protein